MEFCENQSKCWKKVLQISLEAIKYSSVPNNCLNTILAYKGTEKGSSTLGLCRTPVHFYSTVMWSFVAKFPSPHICKLLRLIPFLILNDSPLPL